MVTDARDPSAGTREHFLRVTQLQRWGTIQEYVDLCRLQGYFTSAFYRKATAHMERIHVRRMLRQVTDGRGWPTVGNIVRVGPTGRPERVFMQEALFGSEEYRQVVAYHYGMARHHLFKAQTYRDHKALEEFHHLGIRFISVQDQVDTESPMGKAMFTVIGAMAELESALISERVKAGMEAAKVRGKHLGRPATPPHLVARVENLAQTTEMSIRQITDALPGKVSRSVVGHIVQCIRKRSRAVSL